MRLLMRVYHVFHKNGKLKVKEDELARQRKLEALKDEAIRLNVETQKHLMEIRAAWNTVGGNGHDG